MRRRLACLTALAVTAALAALPATAATPCGRAAADKRGAWFVATPPAATRSPARAALTGERSPVRAVAVDPGDPRVVYVTDGAHLQRSADGGCTWRQVYALPATPDGTAGSDAGDIRSIDVARVGGRSRVLLAVEGAAATPFATRTAVVRSADGVTGWTATSDATFTGTYDLQRAPWVPSVRSAGDVVYAAVPSASGTVAYFRSTNGGLTWTLRTLPDPGAPVRMTGFAVNPWQPAELWEWGGRWSRDGAATTGLRRSTDGGATWQWLDPWPSYETKPGWRVANVAWPRRGGPARVVVVGDAADRSVTTDSPVVAWSGDGGASFQLAVPPTRIPLGDAAVAHLANGDTLVVGGDRTAFRIRHGARPPVRADWRPLPQAPELAAFATAGYDLARTGGSTPAVLAVPTASAVQLLTVPR